LSPLTTFTRFFPYTTLFRSILTDDGYTVLADYPSNFSKLDTGLFYHKFTLPTGTGSLGTYVFDVTYYDSPEEVIKKISYQVVVRSEEHTSELQSRENLVCRL